MILEKVLYKDKRVYVLFLLACTIYAGYAYFDMVLDSKTPFKIKAEALVLDKQKNYYLTNYKDWNRSLRVRDTLNSVAIRYREESDWMPNMLGMLSFDDGWVLSINRSIQFPGTGRNPFLPYARLESRKNGRFQFFSGNEKVSDSMLAQGVLFNFPAGSIGNRVALKLCKVDQKEVLFVNDDGLGISYTLPDKSTNVHILFNTTEEYQPVESNFVYSFDDLTPDVQEKYVVQVDPINTFNYRYHIFDHDKSLISSNGASGKEYFQVGNVLFSIDVNQKYGVFTIVLFGIQLFLLAAAAFFFISRMGKDAENPIQESLLIARILFNCFMLLGLPLFMITFGNYVNSKSYDVMLFGFPHLLNTTYGFINGWKYFGKWLSRIHIGAGLSPFLNKNRKFLFLGIITLLFVFIPGVLAFGGIVDNERVFGLIPTLHFQKMLIIAVYIFVTSEMFKAESSLLIDGNLVLEKIPKSYLPNVFLLLFSLLVSIATSDFGSLLFVLIAILLIEVVRGNISLFKMAAVLIVPLMIVLIFLQFDITAESRKLYRLVYSFAAPFSHIYDGFNQGDRESLTYIWFNIKNMMDVHPFGLFGDLKILDVSKSVAHSDYAFHWSMMIGGVWFLGLTLIGLILLLTHLVFVFIATVHPMKTSGNSVLTISNKRLTIILSFWLAITLIQYCYQVFSNFMLFGTVLTGIPMPFISIGRGDFIFTIVLIIGLEFIFFSKSYLQRDLEVTRLKYSYKYFRTSFLVSFSIVGLIVLQLALKLVQINQTSSKANIISGADNIEIYNSKPVDRQGLIEQARVYISEHELTNLPLSVKRNVRLLQYNYYTNSHLEEDEINTFNITQDQAFRKTSWAAHYDFDKRIISGPKEPFGEVKRERFLWNDRKQFFVSNNYYRYLDYSNAFLNYDLSAQLNKVIEEYATESLPEDVRVSVLVLDHSLSEVVVQAQFPNTKQKVFNEPYYVGSVKKGLLLDAALSIDREKYSNFRSAELGMKEWIKYSNNDYSKQLLSNILQGKEGYYQDFDNYLKDTYGMDFWSINGNRYSDRPLHEITDLGLLSIGGMQPYSLVDVTNWYSILTNKAQTDTLLKEILNAPLTTGGTAGIIGDTLTEMGYDPEGFIAKTGTLESNNKNISSTIVLANEKYTIAMMMSADSLPSNSSRKTSKYLLSELLPLLSEYGVLSK